MKSMYLPVNHHNDFVATPALEHMILQLTKSVTVKETAAATTAIHQVTKIVQ